MGPTDTLTVAAVAAGAVGPAWLVVRQGRRRGRPRSDLRLGDLVGVVAVAGLVVLGGLVVVLLGGVDSRPFTVVHAAYLALVVTGPVLGLTLLATFALGRERRRRRSWVVARSVLALLLVVPAPLGWWATHVEPDRLRVDRAQLELPAARAGRDPIRIGVLADLQASVIGAHEERAVRTLMAQRPDVVLVAGDLFQGDDAQRRVALPRLRRLLRLLDAPAGAFVVEGDAERARGLRSLVAGTGLQVLQDQTAATRVGDRRVVIGGSRLLWAGSAGVALRQELSDTDPSTVRILLAHRPDVALNLLPDADVDLVVAGHTHGGQVSVPWWGPLMTASKVPRAVAAGGLHRVDGHPIYVSTGVGVVRQQAPQVRFGVEPSVGLVVLR